MFNRNYVTIASIYSTSIKQNTGSNILKEIHLKLMIKSSEFNQKSSFSVFVMCVEEGLSSSSAGAVLEAAVMDEFPS